ncbi:MAG: peroxiredoxin family protein [Chloroflexi bacterium]|nr:peroxiredoxin family protein [Chloroflexota bacterium]MCI0578665.1 peroxiredoxin family protein [Chloroflexota bacterium]
MSELAMEEPGLDAGRAAEVGQPAPEFSLSSIQGETVSLADYGGRQNVILWFSRGFTCNFCRGHMERIAGGYETLQSNGVEVIQVAPNLSETAQNYFRNRMPRHPFICDPDKRLYAVYGLGDRGALEATRNTFVSFSTAFMTGVGVETVRASWVDVMNRNFIRRLHHHALTAVEQGVFIIDRQRIVRYRSVLGAVEPIPTADDLLALTVVLCP